MSVKKEYNIGDDAWIYGISKNNSKPIKGSVVYKFDLSSIGYSKDIIYYVISIPTEIEPLLEVRSWEDISQDKNGPIGMFREITHVDATLKKINKLGLERADNVDDEDPTPDEIMKALEQSREGLIHKPLHIKENVKPKRKFYNKKKPSTTR